LVSMSFKSDRDSCGRDVAEQVRAGRAQSE
jgi:hypothetical protein